MSDEPRPPEPAPRASAEPAEIPQARLQTRRPFHAIWIIPIVAALIAAFLGYRAISERGPTITITFSTADGLVAGQTRVKHKAVDLGTVRSIDLSRDMTHVDVRVEMRREAARVLTDHARFWVVRPRLSAANISGLDTLISGSYIELDPGAIGGNEKLTFTGLEEPPAVRSDEPGRTFVLKSDRIGSLSSGSPVFYRDIAVGEVLGYDLGPEGEGVTIHVFVREPYDNFVRDNSHFWNVSGLAVDLSGQGVQVHIASLQALLSGGVAFDTPKGTPPGPVSKPDVSFRLYGDESEATAAGYEQRIPFVTYVEGSVRGLTAGAPVQLFGIDVGNVTDVQLQFDPTGANSRVAINMELQPERILQPNQHIAEQPIDVARNLVKHGLRVQLQTTSFVTGQLAVAMVFVPDAAPADVTMQDGAIVLPSVPGGLDSITSGLSEISTKLARLPLDQIAKNLNDALRGASDVTNGPELKQVLTSMAATLSTVQGLVRTTDADVTPALKRLPEIAQSLQTSVDRAGRLVSSVDTGYGANSEFRRDMERLLLQVSDTARSVRLLADYLDQHPEALIRGRADVSGQH